MIYLGFLNNLPSNCHIFSLEIIIFKFFELLSNNEGNSNNHFPVFFFFCLDIFFQSSVQVLSNPFPFSLIFLSLLFHFFFLFFLFCWVNTFENEREKEKEEKWGKVRKSERWSFDWSDNFEERKTPIESSLHPRNWKSLWQPLSDTPCSAISKTWSRHPCEMRQDMLGWIMRKTSWTWSQWSPTAPSQVHCIVDFSTSTQAICNKMDIFLKVLCEMNVLVTLATNNFVIWESY